MSSGQFLFLRDYVYPGEGLPCDRDQGEGYPTQPPSGALSKITTYMREHYREELKLSDVAATFGYSDAYLSRMFQKYAKINYKTYLQDIRMAYAYREFAEYRPYN